MFEGAQSGEPEFSRGIGGAAGLKSDGFESLSFQAVECEDGAVVFGEASEGIPEELLLVFIDDELAGGQGIDGDLAAGGFEGDFAIDLPGLGLAVGASGGDGLMVENGFKPVEEFSLAFSIELIEVGVSEHEGLLDEIGRGELGLEIRCEVRASGEEEVFPAVAGEEIKRFAATIARTGNDRSPLIVGALRFCDLARFRKEVRITHTIPGPLAGRTGSN